jgi:hypothetical protein
MKRVNLGIVFFLTLSACSPVNQAVIIDKSQIDMTSFMVQDLNSPRGSYYNILNPPDPNSPVRPGTNVVCHLLVESGALNYTLTEVSGRIVHFTDGRVLLATGRIIGLVTGPRERGFTITLASPEAVGAFYKSLQTSR